MYHREFQGLTAIIYACCCKSVDLCNTDRLEQSHISKYTALDWRRLLCRCAFAEKFTVNACSVGIIICTPYSTALTELNVCVYETNPIDKYCVFLIMSHVFNVSFGSFRRDILHQSANRRHWNPDSGKLQKAK